MVLGDVILEKVTPQRARDTYGVVIDPEGRTVNWEETQRLRQSLRHPVVARS